MKTLISVLLGTAMAFTLSGCVIVAGEHGWDDRNNDSHWEKQQKDNLEMISNLELMVDRTSVVEKLGVPSLSDAFVKGDDHYRVLYYRTKHTKSDGETTKDETTPLVFKNNQLIGWGHDLLIGVR
jgi:outer membrane protein assembly factor BamE (lipoprotein component of BamABCDE complex)